jgi:proline iminopeptidase
MGSGASFIYPDEFAPFRDAIPEVERGDLIKAYYGRITEGSMEERLKFARLWSMWEVSTSKLKKNAKMVEKAASDKW